MTNWGDAERIRNAAVKLKTPMWNDFERIRPELTEIAKAYYPLAVDGLTRAVQDMHSPHMFEDEDRDYDLSLAGRRAFKIGVSGFYVNMFSPARRNWRFVAKPTQFATGGDADEQSAKDLDALTEASRYIMYHSKTYREVNTIIKHLLAFGFGCLLVRPESERERKIRGKYLFSQCLRMGTYAMAVDGYGEVNRIIRHFAYTAEQLVQIYGAEELPESVMTAYQNGSNTRYEVWNLIEPHVKGKKKDPRRFVLDYEKFSYRSISWLAITEGQNHGLLEVSGFTRKPFVAPRLEFETGDVYGVGNGCDSIGLIKALQTICEDCLDISGQAAQPAVCVSEELRNNGGGIQLGRRGVNWVPAGEQGKNAITRALADPPSSREAREEGARIQQELKDSNFNNEFASINMDDQNNPVRTATEIEYRKRQSLEQLSGAATTLEDELSGPLATMMRDYALELGLCMLPVGTEIDKLDIRYESAVHKAMNAPDINSRTEGLGFAIQVAELQMKRGDTETVLDNFDLDALIRRHYRTLGAPEKDLVTEEKRNQDRERRQAALAQRAQVAARAQGAAIAKDEATAAEKAVAAKNAAGGDLAAALGGMEV